MLKKAAISAAISIAISQGAYATDTSNLVYDVKAKTEKLSSLSTVSVQNALKNGTQIIIKDTAYLLSSTRTDKFGSSYSYKDTSGKNALIIRERNGSLTGTLIENGVKRSLALSASGATLTAIETPTAAVEHPDEVVITSTSSSTETFVSLKPSLADTYRAATITNTNIATLPETAGSAFFISAQSFIDAEAQQSQYDESTDPQILMDKGIDILNAALEDAGVEDTSVYSENFYLVAGNEGESWSESDVLFKTLLGSGKVDFISSVRTGNIREETGGSANLLSFTNDSYENAEQRARFLRSSNIRYVPYSSRIVAHSFGHNMGLNHNRESESQTFQNALPYGMTSEGNFTTIMALGDNQISYFSDPTRQVDGVAIGKEETLDDAADNAQFLRKTSKITAHSAILKGDTTIDVTDTEVSLGWTPLPNNVGQNIYRTSYSCDEYRTGLSFYQEFIEGTNATTIAPTIASVEVDPEVSACYVIVNWLDLDDNLVPIVVGMQEYTKDSRIHVDNINVSTVPGSTSSVPIQVTDAAISNDNLRLAVRKVQRSSTVAAGYTITYESFAALEDLAKFVSVSFEGTGTERVATFKINEDYHQSIDWIESLKELELQDQLIPMYVFYDTSTTDDYSSISLDMRGMYEAFPDVYTDNLVATVGGDDASVTVEVTEDVSADDVTIHALTTGFDSWTPDYTVANTDNGSTVTVTAPATLFDDNDAEFVMVRIEFGDSRLFKDIGFIPSTATDDGDDGGDDGGDNGGDDGGDGGDDGGDGDDGDDGGDNGGDGGEETPTTPTPTPGSDSGGGGSMGLFGLLALAFIGLRRRIVR
ncbi:GlyGly-CTERM sorting domain-containing protein [Alteromonas pelagimontana]|uniref:GlyGly-CTERM sorting domain-containing protein n=1 Tax=Alteromonas pelagimontana TaxID=1858656 RepID=A0A6M4M9V7_9ALTE|nr:GlyGly-CTERM sorting domain-containing protein [Alteromonas pelagimontana]QJR79887.1 GlyGly-CTERM sorting domain-containing protein [Alteromonas pelagimontana]